MAPSGGGQDLNAWRSPASPTWTFALRHTATMLLTSSKTDPKTAQGILGHADVMTTLKIYTHFA
jgi:site-specific recombinase XerD